MGGDIWMCQKPGDSPPFMANLRKMRWCSIGMGSTSFSDKPMLFLTWCERSWFAFAQNFKHFSGIWPEGTDCQEKHEILGFWGTYLYFGAKVCFYFGVVYYWVYDINTLNCTIRSSSDCQLIVFAVFGGQQAIVVDWGATCDNKGRQISSSMQLACTADFPWLSHHNLRFCWGLPNAMMDYLTG